MAKGQKGWSTTGIKTIKDFYGDYLFYFEKSKPKIRATDKQFVLIIRTFFSIVMMKIIGKGKVFWFGAGIGSLRISRQPVNNEKLAFDYGVYNKTGIKAGFLNAKDGFQKYKFHWDKRFCDLRNKSVTSFTATMEWKQYLAKVINSPDRDFEYELANKNAE